LKTGCSVNTGPQIVRRPAGQRHLPRWHWLTWYTNNWPSGLPLYCFITGAYERHVLVRKTDSQGVITECLCLLLGTCVLGCLIEYTLHHGVW